MELTSRPSREAANRLYRRMGFEPQGNQRLQVPAPDPSCSRLVQPVGLPQPPSRPGPKQPAGCPQPLVWSSPNQPAG